MDQLQEALPVSTLILFASGSMGDRREVGGKMASSGPRCSRPRWGRPAGQQERLLVSNEAGPRWQVGSGGKNEYYEVGLDEAVVGTRGKMATAGQR